MLRIEMSGEDGWAWHAKKDGIVAFHRPYKHQPIFEYEYVWENGEITIAYCDSNGVPFPIVHGSGADNVCKAMTQRAIALISEEILK